MTKLFFRPTSGEIHTKPPVEAKEPKAKKRSTFFFEHFPSLELYKDERDKHGIALVRQMHFTQGSRYEAARRLNKKNSISIVSILVVTFYAMLFSVISSLDKATEESAHQLLSLLSLFMSAAIAAFSIYEGSKRYEVRAENFVRSARDIAALRDRLVNDYLSKSLSWERLRETDREYTALLQRDTDNHAHLDYDNFIASSSQNTTFKYKVRILYFLEVHWLLAFAFASPLFVFLVYLGTAKAAALCLWILKTNFFL